MKRLLILVVAFLAMGATMSTGLAGGPCPPCVPCPPYPAGDHTAPRNSPVAPSQSAPAQPSTGAEALTSPSSPATSPATQQDARPSPSGNADTQTPNSSNDYSSLGETSSGYQSSYVSVAGVGLAAAMGGAQGNTPIPQPLILPGMLTSADVQWTMPQNRIFVDYSRFEKFQVISPTVTLNANGGFTTTQEAGFNLNTFDVGFEKTILDGRASLYGRVPFLSASEPAADVRPGSIDGVGDLEFGFKYLLKYNCETGDAMSVGLSVDVPTGQPGVFTWSARTPGTNGAQIDFASVSINPVFLQPWTSFLLNYDRFFVQEYLGILVPVSNEVVPALNNDVTVGYRLWTAPCKHRTITSITPMVSAQVLTPLSTGGVADTIAAAAPAFPISFPTQLFLTEGLQVGIGERLSVFGGVIEPLVGPQAFTLGVTCGASMAY